MYGFKDRHNGYNDNLFEFLNHFAYLKDKQERQKEEANGQ